MTGILDELNKELIEENQICKYSQLVQTLDQQDQDDLELAIKNNYTTAAIIRVLKKRDLIVGYSTLSRHRRGECNCGIS